MMHRPSLHVSTPSIHLFIDSLTGKLHLCATKKPHAAVYDSSPSLATHQTLRTVERRRSAISFSLSRPLTQQRIMQTLLSPFFPPLSSPHRFSLSLCFPVVPRYVAWRGSWEMLACAMTKATCTTREMTRRWPCKHFVHWQRSYELRKSGPL